MPWLLAVEDDGSVASSLREISRIRSKTSRYVEGHSKMGLPDVLAAGILIAYATCAVREKAGLAQMPTETRSRVQSRFHR